jgi:hypothetical protein
MMEILEPLEPLKSLRFLEIYNHIVEMIKY